MKKIIMTLVTTSCLALSLSGCPAPGAGAGAGTGTGTGTLTKAAYLTLINCAIEKTPDANLKAAWQQIVTSISLIPDATWDTAVKNIPNYEATLTQLRTFCPGV